MPDAPVRVARRLDEVPAADSVVTIGVFDGVHRGHRTLIGRARRQAEDLGIRSVVVTFDRHPMEVVRPGSQPKYLQSLDRKITSLLAEGIDLVYVVTFDYEFSQQSAEAFIQQTLAGPVQAQRVIVGSNFRFGHGAEGDVVLLAERGEGVRGRGRHPARGGRHRDLVESATASPAARSSGPARGSAGPTCSRVRS